MKLQKCPILIIGAGPVGIHLAAALKKRGLPLLALTSRDKRKATLVARELKLSPCSNYLALTPKAKLILITVSDDAIVNVVHTLRQSGLVAPGTFLAHTSGVLSSDILKAPRTRAFSIHPLYTFPRNKGRFPGTVPEGQSRGSLRGVPFVYEGDPGTQTIAKELAEALGGMFFRIKKNQKPIYHAAACIASNFMVTLAGIASELNRKAGISKNDSLSILLPLMSKTVVNLLELGIPKALTGPIQRGDLTTIEKHLSALKKTFPDRVALYKRLSRETLKLAKAGGLSPAKAARLERIFRS